MVKRTIIFAVLGIIGLMVLGACGLLQEPEEASAPIEAIPLEVDVGEEEGEFKEDNAQEEPNENELADDEADGEHEDEASEEAEHDADSGTNSDAGTGEAVVFSIDPSQSEVRFELDEDLRGERKKVVGVTDQVAGELAIDSGDLSTAQVGAILINARTLLTDNDFRNRAIQNEILDTGDYEFITFEPKNIEGLPAAASLGETVSFSIVGDLTIRDITQEVVFETEATLTSEQELSGSAVAIVTREDFDLNIPSVPNVANVEQEVELYIDFVASR